MTYKRSMEPMRALFLDTTRGAYSAPKCSYINKKATAKQNNSLELVINLVSQSIVLIFQSADTIVK